MTNCSSKHLCLHPWGPFHQITCELASSEGVSVHAPTVAVGF